MKEAKDSLRFIDSEIILLPSHGMILSFADIALKVYPYILTRKTVSNISKNSPHYKHNVSSTKLICLRK